MNKRWAIKKMLNCQMTSFIGMFKKKKEMYMIVYDNKDKVTSDIRYTLFCVRNSNSTN